MFDILKSPIVQVNRRPVLSGFTRQGDKRSQRKMPPCQVIDVSWNFAHRAVSLDVGSLRREDGMKASWRRLASLGRCSAFAGILWLALWGCAAVEPRVWHSAGTDLPVTFVYEDDGASEVCVAGDFNGWNPEGHRMRKQGGRWLLRISLSTGRHAYVFVVDRDRWVTDPGALLTEDNGFGGENSILLVE